MTSLYLKVFRRWARHHWKVLIPSAILLVDYLLDSSVEMFLLYSAVIASMIVWAHRNWVEDRTVTKVGFQVHEGEIVDVGIERVIWAPLDYEKDLPVDTAVEFGENADAPPDATMH